MQRFAAIVVCPTVPQMSCPAKPGQIDLGVMGAEALVAWSSGSSAATPEDVDEGHLRRLLTELPRDES